VRLLPMSIVLSSSARKVLSSCSKAFFRFQAGSALKGNRANSDGVFLCGGELTTVAFLSYAKYTMFGWVFGVENSPSKKAFRPLAHRCPTHLIPRVGHRPFCSTGQRPQVVYPQRRHLAGQVVGHLPQ